MILLRLSFNCHGALTRASHATSVGRDFTTNIMSNCDAPPSTGNVGDMGDHRPTLVEDTSVDGTAGAVVCPGDLGAYTEIIWQGSPRSYDGLYQKVLEEWLDEYEQAGHQGKDGCAERIVAHMEDIGILFIKKKSESESNYERTELHAIKSKVKRDIKALENELCGKAPQKSIRARAQEQELDRAEASVERHGRKKVCHLEDPQDPLQPKDVFTSTWALTLPGEPCLGTFGDLPLQPEACLPMDPGTTSNALLHSRAMVSPFDFDGRLFPEILSSTNLSKTFEEDNTHLPASVFSQYDGFFESNTVPCALLPSSASPPIQGEVNVSCEANGAARGSHDSAAMQELIGLTGDFGQLHGVLENAQVKTELQGRLQSQITCLKARIELPDASMTEACSALPVGSRKRSLSNDSQDGPRHKHRQWGAPGGFTMM